jgi:hypothetical protein
MDNTEEVRASQNRLNGSFTNMMDRRTQVRQSLSSEVYFQTPIEKKKQASSIAAKIYRKIYGKRSARPKVERTSQMEDLEYWIADMEFQNQLVNRLLADHSDKGNMKVRFIAAVLDIEKTRGGRMKSRKGRKIISLFLCPENLGTVPYNVEQDLIGRVKIHELVSLKDYFLSELLNDPLVIRSLEEEDDKNNLL